MARRDRRAPRTERIRGLLEAGDHAAARAEAQAAASDEAAGPEERQAAVAALSSLSPEPGAVLAGALGVAAAIAISVAVLLRS